MSYREPIILTASNNEEELFELTFLLYKITSLKVCQYLRLLFLVKFKKNLIFNLKRPRIE